MTDTVAVYVGSGSKVHQLPVHVVNWNHPATVDAMPLSKALWAAGHKVPEFHCYFMDAAGEPNRVTLVAVAKAIQNGITTGRVGQLVPENVLRSGRNDFELAEKHFKDAIWRISGGSREKMESLLKDAVVHDARCLARLRKYWTAYYSLARQRMIPVRDVEGRPGTAIAPPNASLDSTINLLVPTLRHHHQYVSSVKGLYQFIAEELSRQFATGGVPTAAVEPRSSREPIPAAPRAVPSDRPADHKQKTEVALPKRGQISRREQALVEIDVTPLDKEAAETLAALEKAKSLCLDKASRECV